MTFFLVPTSCQLKFYNKPIKNEDMCNSYSDKISSLYDAKIIYNHLIWRKPIHIFLYFFEFQSSLSVKIEIKLN